MKFGTENLRFLLGKVNWLGLVMGILMLILPFLGFWWVVTAGEGAAEIGLSPFDYRMTIAGQPFQSTLVGLFLLAAKISFILGGIFMVMGSVLPRRWWSRRLVRFGVMKPFWRVIFLVIMVVAGTILMNNVVPGLLSQMAGQTGGGGAIQTTIDLPYFSGSTQATIAAGPATVSTTVNLALTGAFWFAVVTAGLGIATRIILRKFKYLEK